ncbi:MAG: tetratricopeptide repeat protein, partial [Chloroflexia bacterium]|nr:tetratricopeptide repeat protein [Chloroflexia bacterium]
MAVCGGMNPPPRRRGGSGVELSDLVGRAQEAMDRGEYRLVVASCSHALETYPTCVSLHRMLGEAHLEQGETEPAIEHFERVLSLDPLNVYVRLGLGVAFEERSDPRGAYTHYLHAWELNPALDQLRDELLRLRTVLGASGCLHPTRAGLAAIYARGGRLSRAAAEWRAVLATDGENSWARMALAEVLWRQGDDAGAATACLAGLRDAPENVRALAILAEIERRKQGLNARTYTDQYRAIDPIGDVVHGIVESRPGADFSFLAVDHAFVEEFDFDQVLDDAPAALGLEEVAGAATPAAIRHSSQMGAPDLWDSLVKDLEHDKTAVISPFSWTDDSGAAGSGSAAVEAELSLDDLLTSDAPAPPLATGAMEAEPLSTAASVELDDESRSLPEPGFDEAQHIEAGALLEAPAVYAGMAIAQEAPFSLPPVEVSEEPPAAASAGSEVGRGYTAYLSDIEPFSFEPADEAAYSDADPLAFAPEDGPGLAADAFAAPESGADLAVEPMELAETVAPEPDPELVLEPARANVEQFITADGRVDLTVGWDDLDRTLQEATPALGAVAGFDGLLAELDAGGIAPFDLLAPTSDDSTWEPFGDDDFASPAPVALPVDPVALAAVAPAAAVESGVSPTLEAADTPEDPAGESWTLLEEELASAIPDDLTSGYTEVFRSLDEFERLEPYVSSPEETVIHAPVVPDSVGEPLEFDDLLSVTSQDLTALLDERDVANADVDFGPVDVDPLSV